MNSKERFYSAITYKGFDRIPATYYGPPEINSELMKHFGVDTYEELLLKAGDDFRHVEPSYTTGREERA